MLVGAEAGTWIWLLLSTLVVWRVTAFVCYEEGPFDIMVLLRRGLVRIGLGRLVGCFHCTAVWISLVTVAAVYHPAVTSIFLVLAVAGAASIVERSLTGPEMEEVE